MVRKRVFRSVGCLALGVLLFSAIPASAQTAAAGQKQTAPPSAKKKTATRSKSSAPASPQLEPRAVEILEAASHRLAAAHTMSFVAMETFESLSRQGAPLVFAHRSEVTLQRPDKLRVILSGDGPASEFYYDGKTMMALAPAENTVAVTSAPPTIDAALKTIYDSAAIYFPFTDLIVSDPYGDLGPGLKHAYYVGQSTVIGGTTTDIVAYLGDGVFVQMWVGAEDKLPRMMHAVFLNDPEELRHNLMLSDWKIDAPVPAGTFTSSKAATARRMEFAHPHPVGTTGVKPTKSRSPAKTKPSNPAPPSESHGR
jgi:hypothetical protein